MRFLFLLIITLTCLTACKVTSLPSPETTDKADARPSAQALSQQVIVHRTQYGVPHIEADNLIAAGYALGFLQMEDHATRVVELLLKARGEWAKHNDLDANERDEALDDDAANKLKYQRAVETWPQLEPATQDFIDGFVKGVNRYIALHPEEFEQWPALHFTVYDAHARNIVSFSHNTIRRFLDAYAEESAERLARKAPESVWASLAARATEPNPDVGSNVWAFGPERTASGHAILMRNPHLSWDAGYYEAHIKVPGALNFYGDFRVGQALGIIGGFNQRLGWSTTNNAPDLDEVYSFEADVTKPDHYILDGVSIPLDKEQILLEYKFGNAIGTTTREFWSTEHGPVILRDAGKIYVLKSAGAGEFRVGEQFLKMMKSQNLQEWKEAMQMRARVSSNLTYADVEGNIFYVWNASMPIRPHAPGHDKTAFHVRSSDEMWQSITAWDDLPQLENPEGGYLRNENDPFHFTNLNEILAPENYPPYYPSPQLRLRSQHSIELIHNDKKFTLEDVVALKHSERMIMADRVKSDLIEALEQTQAEGEMLEALQLIKAWDNTVARDSLGAVLFKTWWNRYSSTADEEDVESSPESVGYSASADKLFKQPWSYDKPTTTPYGLADYARAVESFEWAMQEASKKYGHWNVAWGEVHRAVIGELDLPVGGCTGLLGCYRVIWYTKHDQNDKRLQVRGGDGWVLAVEFSPTPRAYSVLAYGQSDKEESPHRYDQLQDFTNNVMTPVAFSDEDIKNNLLTSYRPGASQ
jgi:acyl-homoserine-lactone acylase